jgi:hypothetical protein
MKLLKTFALLCVLTAGVMTAPKTAEAGVKFHAFHHNFHSHGHVHVHRPIVWFHSVPVIHKDIVIIDGRKFIVFTQNGRVISVQPVHAF